MSRPGRSNRNQGDEELPRILALLSIVPEAMDASRQIVRDRKVVLPRGGKVIQEFAGH